MEPDTVPPLTEKAEAKPRKEEFQLTTVKMTKEQHGRLKVLAIENGTDMSALIQEAIDAFLESR